MNQTIVNLLGSFIVTVLMVTFSWIGLSDFKWAAATDSLDFLQIDAVKKELLPLSLLPEIKQLERTTRYESMRVGAAGSISSNYSAFNKIKNSQHSELIFAYLINQDNVIAKLYALQGFKQIESPYFNQLKGNFEDSEKIIEVQSGCSVYHENMSALYKQVINVVSNK